MRPCALCGQNPLAWGHARPARGGIRGAEMVHNTTISGRFRGAAGTGPVLFRQRKFFSGKKEKLLLRFTGRCHRKIMDRTMALALADKVADGTLTLAQAKRWAKAMLWDNPVRFYGLQ